MGEVGEWSSRELVDSCSEDQHVEQWGMKEGNHFGQPEKLSWRWKKRMFNGINLQMPVPSDKMVGGFPEPQ